MKGSQQSAVKSSGLSRDRSHEIGDDAVPRRALDECLHSRSSHSIGGGRVRVVVPEISRSYERANSHRPWRKIPGGSS